MSTPSRNENGAYAGSGSYGPEATEPAARAAWARSRRINAAVQGASLIAGPLVSAVAAFYWNGEGRTGITGGVVGAIGAALWLYGLLGLWDRLRPERPVLAALGSLLVIAGTYGGISFGLQGFYEELFGVDKAHSLAALAGHPVAAPLVLWLPGVSFPASLVALGILLYRARRAPAWAALAFAAAGALFPISRIPRIEAVAHVADLLLLVPSAYLGYLLIRGIRDRASASRA